MYCSAILPVVAVCLMVTAAAVANDLEESATLIVVASDGNETGTHEFLVLRATRDIVSWKFMEAKGGTKKGLDPEGETLQEGTVRGNSKMLTSAFRATLGEIIDTKQPPLGNQQRVPCNVSIILIDSAGVRTSQLWSGNQRRRLVDGEELKAVFSEVRKKVFGRAIKMPDLLRVGMDPNLAEPKIPVQNGPEWKTP